MVDQKLAKLSQWELKSTDCYGHLFSIFKWLPANLRSLLLSFCPSYLNARISLENRVYCFLLLYSYALIYTFCMVLEICLFLFTRSFLSKLFWHFFLKLVKNIFLPFFSFCSSFPLLYYLRDQCFPTQLKQMPFFLAKSSMKLYSKY